jgi:hypothetical protein
VFALRQKNEFVRTVDKNSTVLNVVEKEGSEPCTLSALSTSSFEVCYMSSSSLRVCITIVTACFSRDQILFVAIAVIVELYSSATMQWWWITAST